MNELEAAVVENELKRIQAGVFDAWCIYMTWYTWFFGANLIVLGWIFTQGMNPLKPRDVALLSAAWMIFNLSGVISSLRLRSFTMQAIAQALELSRTLAPLVTAKVKLDSNLGFPSDLGNVGALANVLALGINICLWLYLFIREVAG